MWCLTRACALVLGLVSGLAGTAHAQTSGSLTNSHETRVSVWSLSGSGRNDLLRRARPAGDMATWLPATDPLVRHALASFPQNDSVTLLFDIGADGRATDCTIPTSRLPAEITDGLCERLMPQVRYLPALTAEGERVADKARFHVRYGAFPRDHVRNTPLIVAEPLPPSPPVPMAGPGWPPLVSLKPARLTGGLPLLEGGGDAPEATGTPWTGVEIQLDEAGRVGGCNVVRSSDDARFNNQACTAARHATYALNGADTPYQRRVYLLITRQNGELRALPQSRSGQGRPVLTEDARATLRVQWGDRPWPRVFVSTDAQGQVSDCRINETTGQDDLDIGACRLVHQAGVFAPARDSLDRPTIGSVMIESLAPGS